MSMPSEFFTMLTRPHWLADSIQLVRRLRRFSEHPRARKCRSRTPRIEGLEDRLAPAISVTGLVTLSGYAHGPYDPPVVDGSGNVYTSLMRPSGQSSLIEIPAGGQGYKTLAKFPSSVVDLGSGGLNSGLAVDGVGNVFGASALGSYPESVFEVPAGKTGYQLVPGVIYTQLQGGNLEGLAVGGGNIYGLSVGGYPSAPQAAIWQLPVGGGNYDNFVANWQYPAASRLDTWSADGLTLSNGVLYGVTNGTVLGSDTVFSVSTNSGTWTTLRTFTSPVQTGLAITGGYVYGTLADGWLFKLPIEGAKAPQIFGVTAAQKPVGGLVVDGGRILGVGAAGKGSIFSVDVSTPTPTVATLKSLQSLGATPLSGLAVDSHGNAYGIDYGTSGVGVYKVSGIPNAPPTVQTFTWTGLGDGLWSNAADWMGPNDTPAAPSSHATVNLVFPSNAQNKTTNMDDIPGLVADSIVMSGNYILSGGSVVVAAAGIGGRSSAQKPKPETLYLAARGLVVEPAPGESGPSTGTVEGDTVLDGVVPITAEPGCTAIFNGAVSGSGGIIMQGQGTLFLNNVNQYLGNTVLKSGILELGTGGSIGLGELTLQGGLLLAALKPQGSSATFELSNRVTINGNAIISAVNLNKSNNPNATLSVALGSPLLGTNVTVMGTSSLKALVDVQVLTKLSISAATKSQPAGRLELSFGHLTVNGTLATGGRLDVSSEGTLGVGGVVSGTGEITVDGTLNANSTTANFAGYGGVITIYGLGKIDTVVPLGKGELDLQGCTLSIGKSLTLTNRQTTLSGSVTLVGPNPSLLVFKGEVTVTTRVEATVGTNIDFRTLAIKSGAGLVLAAAKTSGSDPNPSVTVSPTTAYRAVEKTPHPGVTVLDGG
jgi:hypothetical protein